MLGGTEAGLGGSPGSDPGANGQVSPPGSGLQYQQELDGTGHDDTPVIPAVLERLGQENHQKSQRM